MYLKQNKISRYIQYTIKTSTQTPVQVNGLVRIEYLNIQDCLYQNS